jgi:hypothetical protein
VADEKNIFNPMSTALLEDSFLNRADDVACPTQVRWARGATAETWSEAPRGVLNYSLARRKPARSEQKQQPRVLRRLQGFLLEIQGADARVALVENEHVFQYDLPADLLRRSGIEMMNQPFQMDEIEMRTDQGLVTGYRFQPLANASDAYLDTLNLNDDRKRKRDLILREFAENQS